MLLGIIIYIILYIFAIHYKIIYIYIIRKILEKMYSYTHGHYGFVGTQGLKQCDFHRNILIVLIDLDFSFVEEKFCKEQFR